MFIIHKVALPARKMLILLGLPLCISGWASAVSNSVYNANPDRLDLTGELRSLAGNPADSVLRKELLSANGTLENTELVASNELLANQTGSTGNSSFEVVAYPYFNKIYRGNGVDHMNINLVSLNQTGLAIGDEIGVFDGVYCVGAAVLSETDMNYNTLSIPASANDTVESAPNGYIEGHTISLKLYRNGTVYVLYFQTVNNSTNIFERNGSMFALVDFSQSVDQPAQYQEESVKLYPNPFDNQLVIQIVLPTKTFLDVKIFDQKGRLIRTMFHSEESGQLTLNWDGRDDRKNEVPSGIYFCKINGNTTKIVYKHTK